MNFKKELLNKLEKIKNSYEDGSRLGDYAQGRYANTKMIIGIVKKINYMSSCTELKCEKAKQAYQKGWCDAVKETADYMSGRE
ncbi:hypothetical protein [Tenacibaculum soleae]|uniref:hypothetical protein n=1 Tax=Tenacibaculum soleae TaxID=447689 RepID=UPI002301B001|nr:hypothetical protein [Tenacibaculum soleae]